MYIADNNNYQVRLLNATTNLVSTLAGAYTTAVPRVAVDGPAASAVFISPAAVAVDPAGGKVYVADTYAIRVIDTQNMFVTTVAGSLSTSGYVDGAGTVARFRDAFALALDSTRGILVRGFVWVPAWGLMHV